MNKFDMKHFFKYQRNDILGYLNIVGFTLLLYGAIIGIIVFRHYLSQGETRSLLSTLIIISGTYHSVKSTFPYEGRRHPTFVLRTRYLIKHLLLSVREVYSSQIKIIAFGNVLILINFPEQSGYVFLALFAVLLYWLSLSLTQIYRIIGKVLHLLVIYGMYTNQEILVLVFLCFNVIVLVLNLKINCLANYHLLRPIKRKCTNNISLLKVVKNLISDHLAMMIVIFLVCSAITYLVQGLLIDVSIIGFALPVFFLTISTFITLLEVLVGKENRELELDKGLVVLQFLNEDINSYKAYQSSQSLFWSHILVFTHVVCLVGFLPFLLEGNLAIPLFNLLMLPFIYFISYCYFVKSIRIVSGNLSIFRWSILILYIILTTIAIVGDKL